MGVKSVLGRGVGALLPDDTSMEDEKFFLCDIDKIIPNPNQPRNYFDKEKLNYLAESIRERGVIQPLLVAKGSGNRYNLIAGERRLRAAKMVGVSEVPVVVMESNSENEALELALIENIQRHDLNPIEEATAYERLINEFHLTQEEVARKVGKKRSTVTNILRLLKLPKKIQNDLARGLLTEGHARVLLRIKNDQEQLESIRQKILQEGLSVRETEQLCRKKMRSKPAPSPTRKKRARDDELPSSYCKVLINQLTNHLNSKVRIIQSGSRGKIEIEYYSSDDLDRLVTLLSQ